MVHTQTIQGESNGKRLAAAAPSFHFFFSWIRKEKEDLSPQQPR